jgi:glycosyltransferase involved in cell wall biosynthesis
LKQLIARCPRRSDITLLPWQDDTEAFYAAIDCLMLPSRFEGVPLVMLEALRRSTPVLGSRCDAMLDILPDEWTFDPENGPALAETFARSRQTWKNPIETLRIRIETGMSLDSFSTSFHRAITRPGSASPTGKK